MQALICFARAGVLVAAIAGCGGVSTTEIAGRYALSDDVVLVVEEESGLLTLLPSFWRTAQILEPLGGDEYRSLLHPEIGFRFERGAAGEATQLVVTGHDEIGGTARRLGPNEVLPVEHLLGGRPEEALSFLAAGEPDAAERAARLGWRLLFNFPSRADSAAAFFEGLAERFPGSGDIQEGLGAARVAAGDRPGALPAFRSAIVLKPDSTMTGFALRRLDPEYASPPPGEPWSLPFALDDLFAPPVEAEIHALRKEWQARSLPARGVREVARHDLILSHASFDVRILAHDVLGSRHHTAVLVPAGAEPGCCPVILDLRGVSWNYRPLDLTHGTRITQVLREDARRFVIVVPSFRGEEIRLGDAAYLSEGDRTNAWDGPADDAVAALSVVLGSVPEATGERACAFGKSRGGTVALLVGVRDERVDCVVGWAGPTDWFRQMHSFGWTMQELVSEGLYQRWQPGEGRGSGGQFIEHFLRPSIDGADADLAGARRRVIAASPLHLVEFLPPTQLHHGREDRSVPVSNVQAVADRLAAAGSPPPVAIHVHEGAGHDMPYPVAHDTTRAFLLEHLVP